ncbi:Aste57867_12161 [Aphanomyces stellatus]|uniref:Aste57867_12161 protein n=1 Tax=Aphanomyces stellatus TaxID=120398 RepID=A0A485KVL9_9STRA|nr:hypothetical protein As57867_012116 [Aphanomyces stellatus]VFT89015.1 Aste57867_12161 [Aphanomyces stellatus]
MSARPALVGDEEDNGALPLDQDGELEPASATDKPPAAVSAQQVARLVHRLSVAQDRITKLTRIEKAIADFYVEVVTTVGHVTVRDDSAVPVPTAVDGDTLALINGLRAYVRMQLAFKDDYESSLKSSLKAVTTAQKTYGVVVGSMSWGRLSRPFDLRREERSVKDEVVALKRERDALRVDKETLLAQMLETEDVKARVTHESMASLEFSRAATEHALAQLADCRAELKKTADMCRYQTTQLDDKDQAYVKLSQHVELLKRSVPVGDKPVAQAAAAARPTGEIKTALVQEAERRQATLKISHLEAENAANRDQIKDLKVKLQGVNSSAHSLAFARAVKDAARFKERVKEVELKMAEMEATVMKTRGLLADKDARLTGLKTEYDKLFTALQKDGERKRAAARPHHGGAPTSSTAADDAEKPLTSDEANRLANDNQYVTGFYKAKFEHQAAEILALRKQIKKMLTMEHQQYFDHSLQRKEHQRLLHRYAELKHKVEPDKTIVGLGRPASTPSLATDATSAASSDVKKLVRRNQFLERFFRDNCGGGDMTSTATVVTTKDIAVAVSTRPSSSSITPASSSTAGAIKPRPASAIVKPKHIGDSKQSFVVGSLVKEI